MGFVSVAAPYDDRWYFAEILDGATDRLRDAGHAVRRHIVPPSPEATVAAANLIEQDFADDDCLGAIVTQFKYRTDQGQRAVAWHRPVVVVGGSVLGFPTVMIDDIGAARIATEHLVALGHRRIVHLAGELEDQMDFSVHGRRAKGYRLVMESNLLEPVVVQSGFDRGEAKAAVLEVLQRPNRPTAVFAHSDEVAFGVLDAARELGLRPGEDLSVIGIDDHAQAEEQDLTTVRQVPSEMGAEAAEMLLSGLDAGPDPKRSRLHPVSLVKRGSTARLRTP